MLEFAVECLHKAHHLIDEQQSRDRNLFLPYFELKGEMEEGEGVAPPLNDLSAPLIDKAGRRERCPEEPSRSG